MGSGGWSSAPVWESDAGSDRTGIWRDRLGRRTKRSRHGFLTKRTGRLFGQNARSPRDESLDTEWAIRPCAVNLVPDLSILDLMDSVFANLPAGGRLPSAHTRQLRSRRIVIGLFVVLGLFSIVLAPAASAAGLATVNSTSDAPDNNPGDGVCDTGQNNAAGAAECTLRAAIEEANADNCLLYTSPSPRDS